MSLKQSGWTCRLVLSWTSHTCFSWVYYDLQDITTLPANLWLVIQWPKEFIIFCTVKKYCTWGIYIIPTKWTMLSWSWESRMKWIFINGCHLRNSATMSSSSSNFSDSKLDYGISRNCRIYCLEKAKIKMGEMINKTVQWLHDMAQSCNLSLHPLEFCSHMYLHCYWECMWYINVRMCLLLQCISQIPL